MNDKLIPIEYIKNQLEDVYSTNEVKTNKVWKNGKRIYRKVFEFAGTSFNNHGTTQFNLSVSNVENITNFSITFKHGDNIENGNYYQSSTDRIRTWIYRNTYNIDCYVNEEQNNNNLTLELEYTKTTA